MEARRAGMCTLCCAPIDKGALVLPVDVAEEGGVDGPGVHRERLDHPAAVSAAGKTRFLPPRSGV